jgi:Ran GTPase-activating protein (RanGAP) involved in mRNA processing and transport
LAVVDVHGCRAEGGIEEISSAIQGNPKSQVVYWDLSGNPFDDMLLFCSAIGHTHADVFYLNLSRTGLRTDDTTVLVQSIRSNKHLWGITDLGLAGAHFTPQSAEMFADHLNRISSKNKSVLKNLDLSGVGCFDALLGALRQFPPPLERLKLGKLLCKTTGFDDLIAIITESESLTSLDLSGATLKAEQIDQLISTILQNGRLTEFSLNLSQMGLNGKKLTPVIESFRKSIHEKWKKLAFSDNGMKTEDLVALTDLFTALPGLKSISLGGQFERKDKNLPDALCALLNLQGLEELRLAGNKKSYLGETLLPLLQAVKTHPTLQLLDVTDNRIGNPGVEILCEILSENHTLNELRFDGSHVTDVDTFIRVWEILSAPTNEHLQAVPFPMNDCYQLVQSLAPNRRAGIFDTLSDLQMRAQDRMQTNMALVGIHSELSKKNLSELNELLDNITFAIHEELEGVKVSEHAGLSSAFGLPLPHRNDLEEVNVASEGAETYDAQTGTVVEDTVVATEGLATLQFNSLCIRRPDARGQLARPDSPTGLPPSKGGDGPQPSELSPSGLIPPSEMDEDGDLAPTPLGDGAFDE